MRLTRGVQRIAAERQRQIKEEKWSAKHDDTHTSGQLAMAAVCYAAPRRVFVQHSHAFGVSYTDPFPWIGSDKRFDIVARHMTGNNVPPDPDTYTADERLDLLVKAGALIAAEIDRLLRAKRKKR